MVYEVRWETKISPSSPYGSGVERIEVSEFDEEEYESEEDYACAIALRTLRKKLFGRTVKILSVEEVVD